MKKEKPSRTAGRIVWPKFPKRKREYGREPKRPSQMKSVITSFGIDAIEQKLKEYKVRKCWTEAVGAKIAKKTEPLMLIGSTLHCVVSSSPWITELNYQKKTIIEKVNAAVGEEIVTDIFFKPGVIKESPVQEPDEDRSKTEGVPGVSPEITDEQRYFIESTISSIKDPGLKEAVRRAMERATEPKPKP